MFANVRVYYVLFCSSMSSVYEFCNVCILCDSSLGEVSLFPLQQVHKQE